VACGEGTNAVLACCAPLEARRARSGVVRGRPSSLPLLRAISNLSDAFQPYIGAGWVLSVIGDASGRLRSVTGEAPGNNKDEIIALASLS
jgi:hypothetical protein